MQKLFGKTIRTTIAERISPKHTALLIVDVQNDFCAEGGMLHRIHGDVSRAAEMLPRLQRLLEGARRAGLRIVYIMSSNKPDGSCNSAPDLARRFSTYARSEKILITLENTWGEALMEGMEPEASDIVIKKHRPDAFAGTSLAQVLRSNGIENVVVTGTATFACVSATAYRALMEDFYVTVVEDCVAASNPSLHEAALHVMKAFFGRDCVCSSDKILAIWSDKEAESTDDVNIS